MNDFSVVEFKTSIKDLINTINENKNFSRLIIFSLNRLKSYLMVQNQQSAADNSISILKNNFIKIIRKTYPIHLNNEEVLIKIGEILYYITSNLVNKPNDFEIFKSFNGVLLVKEVIALLNVEKVEANKIFLKIFQIIIEEMQNHNTNDIEEYSSIIFTLIDKFSDNHDLMIYLFESLKKFSVKKFKQILDQQFLNSIINIISTTTSQKIATLGLQILDTIVKTIDSRDMVRSSEPISFVVKLLKRFKDDNLLSFQACAFLCKVIEKEDVNVFLKIMKIKNLKNAENEFENELKFQGGLTEIKDMIYTQDEDTFNLLKKNITRILILMSKDKNFLQLLKDINSLDIFIGLLKSDIEVYSISRLNNKNKTISEKSNNDDIYVIENTLPDLLRLILSLLKNYNVEYEVDFNRSSLTSQRNNSIRMSTNWSSNGVSEFDINAIINVPGQLKEIYLCLLKCLHYFYTDKQIAYDILDYVSSKDKKFIEEILKDFDFKEITYTLSMVLRTYHQSKWVYNFITKMFQNQINFLDKKYEDIILVNMKNLRKILESFKLIYEDEKKENILNLIYETSLNLILHSNCNVNFNENSFLEFYLFCVNYINYISDTSNSSSFDIDILHSLVTILFSCLENKNFGPSNVEEKSKLILSFLKKIVFDVHLSEQVNIFSDILKYLLLRLNRLVDLKSENINKLIFNDQLLCELILVVLSTLKSQVKLDEIMAKETLQIIVHVLNLSDTLQISRFLRENGFILLMQICLHGIYDFDINKLIIHIIQSFSNLHFKESALILKNFLSFRNFINQLKEIKFSKGINEKIYHEILIFVKNIIKSCQYCETAEETNLIEHLVNEFHDIYCFYLDTNNRILEVISEILSTFSKERILLKSLINSQLPIIMENIFKNMSELSNQNDQIICDKLIENLVNIFISFFKSKEYSKLIYNNYKSSLEILKNITFHNKLSESCLTKLLALCNLLVEYENSETNKEKIITPTFFRELGMRIPSSQKTIKEMIDKCIIIIENPFIDRVRRSINDSNSQLIKELSKLVKSDRKNALKPNKVEEDDNVDHKSNNSIEINANPVLQSHFDNIIANINLIIEGIFDPDRKEEINIEQESEQLSDLFHMLCIFAKNEENIKKISDSFIIDKLILIIEDKNDILTFAKDQGFNLIEMLIADQNFINKLYENGKACNFFLKEFNKISKLYFPENSEYIRNKVYIVSKIISKLSSDKIFIINNIDCLTVENVFYIVSNIQCDRDIILNLLVIFNNILANIPSRDFTGLKLSSVIHQLWNKYNDIRVIEKIMKIIENLYLDENIIRDLLELDLIENINAVLKSDKTDSEGMLNLLELLDILMFHRYFAAKMMEQKTLQNFIAAVSLNMFNTKIIEKACSIFLKSAKIDKNFITILGVFGVKEFCLKILVNYMTTCHSNIIKYIQELIFMLISDDNNLSYFSKGESMDIMLKTFKANLKSKEHVQLSLKLINVITTKDVELKVERARERRRTLEKQGIKSTLIKITSATLDNDNSVTYDFTILIEIINEILSTYDEFIDIIMQLCELINNIFKISHEIWLKKFMMDVIVNNADKYILKQDYIEIFLKTMYMMMKADKSILDMDCTSILHYISKIQNVKLNQTIVFSILKILKHVGRSKNINTSSNLSEIIKILKFIQENKIFHNDDAILMFSQILGYLCINTSFYKEVSNEFIIFLLEYLISRSTSSDIHGKLLEDLKNISVYFHIRNSDRAQKVAECMYQAYKINLNDKNKKNMINVFQIISSLCVQSEDLKIALNDIKLSDELKSTLLNENAFDDTLINYQAKGCLLNLKLKKGPNTSSKLTNSSTLRSMSIVLSHVEIKDEVRVYLNTERVVKIYTDKGEIKEKFLIFNDNLDKILAYGKKKNIIEVFQEMQLKEMDSCVRSCGTAAFSKAKGFFTKKPKPARCFSILGYQSINGKKTFNVECEKEEDCIKYVDYISILIQNHKSMKEEFTSQNSFSPGDLLDKIK